MKNTKSEIYQSYNNIKKYLLQFGEFKNIREAKSILGVDNANEVYELLLKGWNEFVIAENKIRMNKYDLEVKKYKAQVKKHNEEQAKKILEEVNKKARAVVKQKKEKKQIKLVITEKKQKKPIIDKKYYESNVIVINHEPEPEVKLYKTLKNLKGKNLIITTYDEKGGDIVTTRNETIPDNDKEFINWWKSTGVWIIWTSSDTNIYMKYSKAVIYIYEADKKINSTKIKQYFKEGNVNCLLKPIFTWAEDCKENSKSASAKSRYNAILKRLTEISNEIGDNGVSETEMIRITNDAQIDISIENPIIVGDDKYVVETKSNKKPLKHFIMRNTKFNHVDHNEFLYLNNIEDVTREELYEIKNKLESENIYYEFKRDLTGYTSINTLEKTWRISNKFMELINEMEIEEGLNECYIDDIDDKELSHFVKMGTHYNATIDFDMNRDGAKHMDMKCAYAGYLNCDFYEGFLGKITDWRKTDKIEGVGLYQITNLKLGSDVKELNDKMKIYFNNNIYPSCELNWLEANDCSFDIVYGCWGVKPVDFDMKEYDFLFEKYDKVKGYAKYTGMCDSHRLTTKFSCYGDESLANTLGSCSYFKNNEITIAYPKKHNYHFGHFTAFILAYQRIQILEQLLYMDYDNLIRVCVDGIYYRGDEKLNKGFEEKTKMTFNNIAGDSYVSNIIDEDEIGFDWNCGEYKKCYTEGGVAYKRELYFGEGGNGKTHKNLTDKGLIRTLYIAPSWKLAEKKRQEYGVDVDVWYNILTTDPAKWGKIKRRYNVFVIDEVSMMTEENKVDIFEKFDNVKLIFCGDIGFQASPFNTTGEPVIEITKKDFDIVYEEKVNYRYKCEKLKKIIADVREMIYYGRPNLEINNYVKNNCINKTNEYVKQNYTINDMILSRSHIVKDMYTEMFKDMNKWYVTKNTRLFKNGQIIIGDEPDTTCEIRHSYTIHSIQGETAEHNLFINMEKTYDSRLLYTAISRARKLEQIILIV